VGGVPGSLHLIGRAADFTGSETTLAEARFFATRYNRPWRPKKVEALIHDAGSGLHLHLGWY